jgi:hypothetical protein
MVTLVITGLVLLIFPMFLLFFFKTNAGMMFLSACAGLVLLGSLDPAVVTTAGAVVPGEGEAYVRLTVVILSILFASLMFRHTVKGSSLILHAFIITLLAITLWIILPGATGVSWLLENRKESLWQDINDFRSLIIATGFSLSMLSVLTHSRRHRSKH